MIKKKFFDLLFQEYNIQADSSVSSKSVSPTDVSAAVFSNGYEQNFYLYIDEKEGILKIRLIESGIFADASIFLYRESHVPFDIENLTQSSLRETIDGAVSKMIDMQVNDRSVIYHFKNNNGKSYLTSVSDRSSGVSESTILLMGTMFFLELNAGPDEKIEFVSNMQANTHHWESVSPGFKYTIGETEHFAYIEDIPTFGKNVIYSNNASYTVGYPSSATIEGLARKLRNDAMNGSDIWTNSVFFMADDIKGWAEGTDLVERLREMRVAHYSEDRLVLEGTSKIEFRDFSLNYDVLLQYRLNDSRIWHPITKDGQFAHDILQALEKDKALLEILDAFKPTPAAPKHCF